MLNAGKKSGRSWAVMSSILKDPIKVTDWQGGFHRSITRTLGWIKEKWEEANIVNLSNLLDKFGY